MNYQLELVIVPVSDVDRAKAFYIEQAGFDLHVDHRAGDDFRVVQLNPPGSACSIAIGTGISDMTPGSLKGLHLMWSAAIRDNRCGTGMHPTEKEQAWRSPLSRNSQFATVTRARRTTTRSHPSSISRRRRTAR